MLYVHIIIFIGILYFLLITKLRLSCALLLLLRAVKASRVIIIRRIVMRPNVHQVSFIYKKVNFEAYLYLVLIKRNWSYNYLYVNIESRKA